MAFKPQFAAIRTTTKRNAADKCNNPKFMSLRVHSKTERIHSKLNEKSIKHEQSDEKYLILSRNKTLILIHKDDKFSLNGGRLLECGKMYHFYFRCNQYRNGCKSKLTLRFDTTCERNVDYPLGKIIKSSLKSCDHDHSPTWTQEAANTKWFLDAVRLLYRSENISAKSAYDRCTILYPVQYLDVPHYNYIKHYIYYGRELTKSPMNRLQRIDILTNTKYGKTYFQRQLIEYEMNMKKENDYDEATKHEDLEKQTVRYHEKQQISENIIKHVRTTSSIISMQKKQKEQLKNVYVDQLPSDFYGFMFVDETPKGSVILSPKYCQYILSVARKVSIDGTFTNIFMNLLSRLNGESIKPWVQVMFIGSMIPAPDNDHVDKLLIVAIFLLVSKEKSEYTKAAEILKEKSPYTFDNISSFSADYESAFDAFSKTLHIPKWDGCYFHFLYGHIRKLRSLQLIKEYKTNIAFWNAVNILMRACHLPQDERRDFALRQAEYVMRSIPSDKKKVLACIKFIEYHFNQWINKKQTFTASGMHGRTKNLTNNMMESFNSFFAQIFGKNQGFKHFLSAAQKITAHSMLDYYKLESYKQANRDPTKLFAPCTKVQKKVNSLLETLENEYNEIPKNLRTFKRQKAYIHSVWMTIRHQFDKIDEFITKEEENESDNAQCQDIAGTLVEPSIQEYKEKLSKRELETLMKLHGLTVLNDTVTVDLHSKVIDNVLSVKLCNDFHAHLSTLDVFDKIMSQYKKDDNGKYILNVHESKLRVIENVSDIFNLAIVAIKQKHERYINAHLSVICQVQSPWFMSFEPKGIRKDKWSVNKIANYTFYALAMPKEKNKRKRQKKQELSEDEPSNKKKKLHN